MLRNLTEPNVLSKVSKRGSWLKQSTSERASIADETEEEDFTSQKHKGRQSNWNPIHLLILQACFTASLRRTADGKYVSTDLSPKERTQISNLTGLSMATISHWLANVKYQLRRSGRTKFLRNLDVGQPVFFCSQCSSQVRSPSAHVYHLESHLGFRMKDFPKLSADKLRKSAMRINKALPRLHSLPADKKGTQPDHHQPACTQTPPQQGSWNKPRGVHIISV
uniref:C2H2-type domain-containing protein n=1 Tax=Denticeps clupeoides TaxID=299321 RepID=A0AAY4BSD1_9TELE